MFISKWNMGNILYIDNMFCNCKSLISIPDIYNWNLNNNRIKSMKNLFKNCKLVSNLNKLSNWKIAKDHFSSDMFEGCKFVGLNYKEKNNIIFMLLNCFKNFIYIIASLYKYLFIIFNVLALICALSLIFYVIFYPIYSSLHLVEAESSISNPSSFFELKNYTNINFIAEYFNISNITETMEKFKNEENFINYILNFTSINEGIKFESDLINYKEFSIISGILNFINLSLFSIIGVTKNKNIDFYKKYKFVLLTLLFLLYIIYIIISLFLLIIINRLHKSFLNYYNLIHYLFKIAISQHLLDEIDTLDDSFNIICMNYCYIFICIIICLCKDSRNYITFRTEKNLEKLIEGIQEL